MMVMNETTLFKSFSYSLSYVVASFDFGDDEPAYRGPVVFTIDGEQFVDMWIGNGLDGYEGPEFTTDFWATVESDIRADLERRGTANTFGAYVKPLTVAEVRARLNAQAAGEVVELHVSHVLRAA
jgi:hypothetical protein